MNRFKLLFCLSCFVAAIAAKADAPDWIWTSANHDGKQSGYFRQTFKNSHQLLKAELTVSADDRADVFLNGKLVATSTDWAKPVEVDVADKIVDGDNVIAVHCENEVSEAGLLLKLELTQPTFGSAKANFDPAQHAGLRWISLVKTDTNWLCSDREAPDWNTLKFDAAKWKPAVSVGKLGDKPWGDIFKKPEATSAESIRVEPGFKVELLHSATAREGSWISMAVDSKGRLIVSPQGEGKLQRITLKHGQVAKIEAINQPVNTAMGLLWMENSLYVNGNGPKGSGIYRLRAKGDSFEAPVLLRAIEGGTGEHGSHGLELGPDKKLYVVNGNFTKLPKDLLPTSPHKNYKDDQLLPRADDGNGFGAGILPPGGFVLRMDLDGKNCELFAAGTRNTYDIAFNRDGELFGFDSDMEWDWGMAWYRPIRINHWVSGGDYGFREGSGKFPEYYEDTLPATLDVGIGSPTGVKFGTGSNFPKKYRDALFMLDWSYGRIIAAILKPRGATYEATLETVVRGKPLNVTDFEFGRDGAMYFITGGRNTQSGLYRLTYIGPSLKDTKTAEEKLEEKNGKVYRRLRHNLEYFQGKRDPKIVNEIWPCLSNEDRWIRYAARIALEFQDVAWWKDRALAETNTDGGLTALMALARCSGKETQRDLLMALKKFPLTSLTEEQELLKLRVIELSFSRQGRPDPDLVALAISKLDPLYPSASENVNRELCQLLLYLKAPDAITKTMDLLEMAPTQEEQSAYILRLRNITNGWTLDQRKQYFAWIDKDHDKAKHEPELLQYFKDAERDYSDGSSFPKFITNFRQEGIDSLSPAEREELATIIVKQTNAVAEAFGEHKFVKDWKMSDVQPDLEKLKNGRKFKSGREAFTVCQCVQCHRFGSAGGSVGPELTAVSSRLAARDILESILEPSKVVSEQYQNTTFNMKNADDVTGRVVQEDDAKIVVMTDPLKMTKVELKKNDVAGRRAAKLSPMPEGLVNTLTKKEILDLIAYLQSGGKADYAAFKK